MSLLTVTLAAMRLEREEALLVQQHVEFPEFPEIFSAKPDAKLLIFTFQKYEIEMFYCLSVR